MNNLLVFIYFTIFAVIAGGSFALMWGNVQSIDAEMLRPKPSKHPEAPAIGEEVLYLDLNKERLERILRDT